MRKMGDTVQRQVVHARLDATQLAALDAYAHGEGLTRAAALRVLVDKALGVGPSGWAVAYPNADDPLAWPTSPELQVEATRRLLWRQASAGSATAAAALDRSLARDGDTQPRAAAPAVDDDPFREVDELAAKRQREVDATLFVD